ncbi:hypothetical protein ACH4F6_25705 [Streptomyces sp. NPDC017936]|uniref:hypothetical protein n=1 Tax=Streptomyces sp. NPDC017936 TaxID=3365016 RepID=UPI0037B60DE8
MTISSRASAPDAPVRALLDGEDFASVEVRGTAGVVPDEERRLPHELSHERLGVDPPAERDDEARVIIRVVPRRPWASRRERTPGTRGPAAKVRPPARPTKMKDTGM